MPRKYQCPVFMEHSMTLVHKWRKQGTVFPMAVADELEAALRKDQHQLFHDGEFADGCDICDKEREQYG